jgi:hypothetical protein
LRELYFPNFLFLNFVRRGRWRQLVWAWALVRPFNDRFRALIAAFPVKATLCGSGFPHALQRDYPRAEASFVGFNGLIYFRILNLGRKESPTVRHIPKHFAVWSGR